MRRCIRHRSLSCRPSLNIYRAPSPSTTVKSGTPPEDMERFRFPHGPSLWWVPRPQWMGREEEEGEGKGRRWSRCGRARSLTWKRSRIGQVQGMRPLWTSLSSSPTWYKLLAVHGVWGSYSFLFHFLLPPLPPYLPFLSTPHSPRTAGPVQIHHFQPNVAHSLLLLQHRLYPGPARRDRLARLHAPPRCLLLGTS